MSCTALGLIVLLYSAAAFGVFVFRRSLYELVTRWRFPGIDNVRSELGRVVCFVVVPLVVFVVFGAFGIGVLQGGNCG